MKLPHELFVLMLGLAVLAGGCKREETVSVERVPKDPPKTAAVHAPEAQQSQAEEKIQWTVPAGWKSMPAGQMRYAVFAVTEGEPQVLLTVIPLPPQPLLPNVNRWEQQLGLPPTPEAELGKVVTRVDVNGVPVDVVDLKGPEKPADGSVQQRMLAAMITRGPKVWFFKMVGPAEKVSSQKANFDAFVRSIRFAGEEGTKSASKTEIRIGEFKAPAGWEQVKDAQPPRMLVFTMGSGDAKAEMAVTKFAGNVGDLPSNVNRWRGQVGLEPTTDMSAHQPQKVMLGGADAPLFEVVGPESAGTGRKRMLVVVAALGEEMWFFKLLGPAEEVARQKAAFEEFLKTVRFVGQSQ